MKDCETLIAMRNVSLSYGKQSILEDVNLDIARQDYLGIVGPNGSGKTSILKALLSLLEPSEGKIEREPSLSIIGYVPQGQSLDPFFPLTTLQIVLMGRYGIIPWGRRPRDEDFQAARSALEQVGLSAKSDKLFRELSGGQQQRVLIARALASGSPLLLLDEPTRGMDLPSEGEIMGLLQSLREQQDLAMVLVSHDLSLIAAQVDSIALLRNGRLIRGSKSNLLSEEALGKTYGVPVRVIEGDGALLVKTEKGSD